MEQVIIRKYKPSDRGALRAIACDTAFLGEPGDVYFDDREILADLLTIYFTDYEPESSFVAESGGEVTGYLTGAKNINSYMNVLLIRILPSLFIKAVRRHVLTKKKNILFLLQFLGSFFKNEFKMPNFSKRYPAILHINLKNGHRSAGTGSRLIAAYLDYLRGEGVAGVHLSSISENGSPFFVKNGFKLLYKKRRTYFQHISDRGLHGYFYGKNL